MTDRDRLIELLKQANTLYLDYLERMDQKGLIDTEGRAEYIADYLIANNIILPPCKVGDTVYKCHTVNLKPNGEITKRTIKQITFSAFTVTDDGASGWFDIDDIGKTVFLTREDAEKALRERDGE